MTEDAMNQILDSLADRIAARILEKMRPATAAPAAQTQAPPAFAVDQAKVNPPQRTAQCDTCGSAMTWKPSTKVNPQTGDVYPARFWCNTRGCKGKAIA